MQLKLKHDPHAAPAAAEEPMVPLGVGARNKGRPQQGGEKGAGLVEVHRLLGMDGARRSRLPPYRGGRFWVSGRPTTRWVFRRSTASTGTLPLTHPHIEERRGEEAQQAREPSPSPPPSGKNATHRL